MDLDHVVLRLFTAWLEGRGSPVPAEWQPAGELYSGRLDDRSLSVLIAPLFERDYGDWSAQKAELEEQLAGALENGSYVLWLPPGAELPLEEPDRSDFVFRLKMRAAGLQAGESIELKIPVPIAVQKQDAEGSYAQVVGGLSPIWSWFTERIRGVYNVDARALTRLPEAPDEREAMVEAISAELAAMEVGERRQLTVEDAWTLQRIAGRSGFAIIGAPADRLPVERETRKRVRAVLAGARTALEGEQIKALVMPGLYLYAAEENVSTAVRGFDPASYAGIDYVVLVADGSVKSIIAPPS